MTIRRVQTTITPLRIPKDRFCFIPCASRSRVQCLYDFLISYVIFLRFLWYMIPEIGRKIVKEVSRFCHELENVLYLQAKNNDVPGDGKRTYLFSLSTRLSFYL